MTTHIIPVNDPARGWPTWDPVISADFDLGSGTSFRTFDYIVGSASYNYATFLCAIDEPYKGARIIVGSGATMYAVAGLPNDTPGRNAANALADLWLVPHPVGLPDEFDVFNPNEQVTLAVTLRAIAGTSPSFALYADSDWITFDGGGVISGSIATGDDSPVTYYIGGRVQSGYDPLGQLGVSVHPTSGVGDWMVDELSVTPGIRPNLSGQARSGRVHYGRHGA